MSVEPRRGCGFRKAGGLYIVGDVVAREVDYLPFCIPFNQTRSLQWVTTDLLLATCRDRGESIFRAHPRLALCFVGAKHYSVASFVEEAAKQGVSRRVASIPKDLKPGDPIALAHPACIATTTHGAVHNEGRYVTAAHCDACRDVPTAKVIANYFIGYARQQLKQRIAAVDASEDQAKLETQLRGVTSWGDPRHVAGVFGLFHMRAVEVVLPHAVANDPDIIRKCADRQVRIVTVPDTDPDHVPAGWKLPRFLLDDESDEASLPLPFEDTVATEDLA